MLKPNRAVNTDFIRVFALVAARRFGKDPAAQNEAVCSDRETVAIRGLASRPTRLEHRADAITPLLELVLPHYFPLAISLTVQSLFRSQCTIRLWQIERLNPG
jgi:hypothetical protein